MSRRIIIFVLAAGAAVFGAIAISQAASTPTAQKAGRESVARPAHRSNTLGRHFAVLGSAAKVSSAGGELPAATAEHLTEPGTMVAQYGLEPDQSRSVGTGSIQAWVVPGSSGICLVVPTPDGSAVATGCGPAADVSRTGIVQVQRPASGPVVYGLVPNGDSVTATSQGGTPSNIAATSNFFTYSGPNVQSVAIRASNGSVVQTAILDK